MHHEAAGIESDDENRDKTAACNNYVKEVPAVRAIASPAQAIQSHGDVDEIHYGKEKKEVICEGYVSVGTLAGTLATYCASHRKHVVTLGSGSYKRANSVRR